MKESRADRVLKCAFWVCVVCNLIVAPTNLILTAGQSPLGAWLYVGVGLVLLLVFIGGGIGWHLKRRQLWQMDFRDIEATREANILLGKLSLDLAKNAVNGDLVAVWRRNRIALKQLGLYDEGEKNG
jgi:hypothetical protein